MKASMILEMYRIIILHLQVLIEAFAFYFIIYYIIYLYIQFTRCLIWILTFWIAIAIYFRWLPQMGNDDA